MHSKNGFMNCFKISFEHKLDFSVEPQTKSNKYAMLFCLQSCDVYEKIWWVEADYKDFIEYEINAKIYMKVLQDEELWTECAYQNC